MCEVHTAVVSPSRKSCHVLNEPRKEIFPKWIGTWLPRGSYGVYVAVKGSNGGACGKVAAYTP